MIDIRLDEGLAQECAAYMDRLDVRWIRLAMAAALEAEDRTGDVCVLLTGNSGIQALNRDYRQVDAVTDVLTFPAWEGAALAAPPDGYLGDVAICVPRAVEQAEAYGHSIKREAMFLAVHGALHLLGYDHMEPQTERLMLEKQEQILTNLGVTR